MMMVKIQRLFESIHNIAEMAKVSSLSIKIIYSLLSKPRDVFSKDKEQGISYLYHLRKDIIA